MGLQGHKEHRSQTQEWSHRVIGDTRGVQGHRGHSRRVIGDTGMGHRNGVAGSLGDTGMGSRRHRNGS